jgi:putative SOS response-associated peptidase YedK
MPVILKPDNEDEWIDHKPKDTKILNELLEPYPSDLTEMYEVSPVVGRANIDVESLIQPVRKML